jgi:hypothetical protein
MLTLDQLAALAKGRPLSGLADNHFDGDLNTAQQRLRENGLARQDPYPTNGAWPSYQPVAERETT